jgi:predicted permease
VKKVGEIVDDSGELIRTPVKWLKDMQKSWLIYVISMAIICLCILFFYCAYRGYFVHRRNTNHLAAIAMIMPKNNNANVGKY